MSHQALVAGNTERRPTHVQSPGYSRTSQTLIKVEREAPPVFMLPSPHECRKDLLYNGIWISNKVGPLHYRNADLSEPRGPQQSTGHSVEGGPKAAGGRGPVRILGLL